MKTISIDKCPKCHKSGKETIGEVLLTHKEYPAMMLQKWYECACGWTWTTEEQRKYNKVQYGRRWRVNT